MMMRFPSLPPVSRLAALHLLLALLPTLCTPAMAGADCEHPRELRFSLVPVSDVERDLRLHRPLFERIETLTGHPVVAVRPRSYAAVVEGLLAGDLDIAKLGPAAYIQAKRGDPRIIPFATQEKRGGVFQVTGPYYHAVLATLKDSRLDLAGLKGKRLALTDPGSTSGALLPRQEFTPLIGMPLERYFGTLIYSGTHGKSLAALLQGEVDAAFIASTQLEEALQANKLDATRIQVLWQSERIPFDPFVMRGQLCPGLQAKIRAAFLDNAASLRPLLDEFEATRYVPAEDVHYERIRRVLDNPPR